MEIPLQSDEQLIKRIAAGDTAALGVIVDRYQEVALSLAYRNTQNWADAEDIAQEAFIRVFKAASRYKADSSFKTWFYRIVVNLCLDSQRKNRPGISLDSVQVDMASEDCPDTVQQGEMAKIVQKAIYNLPERQRIALVLHRYENLSHSQIAEATGWSRSAVESLLVRAYENLRNKLEGLNNI